MASEPSPLLFVLLPLLLPLPPLLRPTTWLPLGDADARASVPVGAEEGAVEGEAEGLQGVLDDGPTEGEGAKKGTEGGALEGALGASVSPPLEGAAVPVGAEEGAGEAEGLLDGLDHRPTEGEVEGAAMLLLLLVVLSWEAPSLSP